MRNQQHTPGPWYCLHPEADQAQIASEREGKTVALTFQHNPADARLIAAAPDLLEACRAMLAIHGPVATVSESVKAIAMTAAAVAKATSD